MFLAVKSQSGSFFFSGLCCQVAHVFCLYVYLLCYAVLCCVMSSFMCTCCKPAGLGLCKRLGFPCSYTGHWTLLHSSFSPMTWPFARRQPPPKASRCQYSTYTGPKVMIFSRGRRRRLKTCHDIATYLKPKYIPYAYMPRQREKVQVHQEDSEPHPRSKVAHILSYSILCYCRFQDIILQNIILH